MTAEPTPKKSKGGKQPGAGRKPVAEPLKRKQRNLYLNEFELLQVQHFILHTLRGVPLHKPKETEE